MQITLFTGNVPTQSYGRKPSRRALFCSMKQMVLLNLQSMMGKWVQTCLMLSNVQVENVPGIINALLMGNKMLRWSTVLLSIIMMWLLFLNHPVMRLLSKSLCSREYPLTIKMVNLFGLKLSIVFLGMKASMGRHPFLPVEQHLLILFLTPHLMLIQLMRFLLLIQEVRIPKISKEK